MASEQMTMAEWLDCAKRIRVQQQLFRAGKPIANPCIDCCFGKVGHFLNLPGTFHDCKFRGVIDCAMWFIADAAETAGVKES